jgi:hypothetical protein
VSTTAIVDSKQSWRRDEEKWRLMDQRAGASSYL